METSKRYDLPHSEDANNISTSTSTNPPTRFGKKEQFIAKAIFLLSGNEYGLEGFHALNSPKTKMEVVIFAMKIILNPNLDQKKEIEGFVNSNNLKPSQVVAHVINQLKKLINDNQLNLEDMKDTDVVNKKDIIQLVNSITFLTLNFASQPYSGKNPTLLEEYDVSDLLEVATELLSKFYLKMHPEGEQGKLNLEPVTSIEDGEEPAELITVLENTDELLDYYSDLTNKSLYTLITDFHNDPVTTTAKILSASSYKFDESWGVNDMEFARFLAFSDVLNQTFAKTFGSSDTKENSDTIDNSDTPLPIYFEIEGSDNEENKKFKKGSKAYPSKFFPNSGCKEEEETYSTDGEQECLNDEEEDEKKSPSRKRKSSQ